MFLKIDTALADSRRLIPSRTVPDELNCDEMPSRRRERILLIALVIIGYILFAVPDPARLQDALWLAFGVIAASSILRNRRGILELIRRSYPLVILLLLAILSTIWSSDPGATLRRSLALLDSAVISVYFFRRLTLQQFIDALFIAIAALASISLLLVIALPSVGVADTGEWQGCFESKNGLGEVMALGFITTLCSSKSTEGSRRFVRGIALSLFLILLLGSKSATSLVVAISAVTLAPIMLWSRQHFATRPRYLIALIFCIASCVYLASTYGKGAVLGILGKDETLTSRTDVWQYAFDAIAERPLLGYGYRSFWLSHGALSGDTGRDGIWATQAHNGFIEIALDMGLAGEAAILLLLSVSITRAAKYFWRNGTLLSAWPLLMIIAVTITNIAEATIARHYYVTWVLVVTGSLFVSQLERRSVTPKDQMTSGIRKSRLVSKRKRYA